MPQPLPSAPTHPSAAASPLRHHQSATTPQSLSILTPLPTTQMKDGPAVQAHGTVAQRKDGTEAHGPTTQRKGGLAAHGPAAQKKSATKTPQRRQPQAVALSAYEKQRLSQCMQNNTRLKELGIPTLSLMFAQAATSHPDKNKSAQRNAEESDSDYDPSRDGDGTGEQDLIDGNAKGSKEKTSYMPPGGGVIKFKNRKRVFVAEPCTRVTRSKKTITNPVPGVNQAAELSGTYDERAQAAIEDDGLALPDDNAHTTDNTERHNHMDSEDHSAQHGDENENATMVAGDRDLTHGDENEHATMAARDRDLTHPDHQMTTRGGQQGIRRATMGHGLERMCRARHGRLQVVINEGSIRPVVPLVAAKWATECNIAVRTHVPVLKHWKDYKDKPALLEMFMGCLRAKFHIDTSDETIKKACREMMKKAVRQQRHNLKKKYFDPFPLHRVTKTSPVRCMSNEQWIDLVESWKSPKKMETCQMNKFSRGNVKSHQKTGSRSYEVFVENNLGDKYKDQEPNAIDLFKECHYSNKTKGFTPEVQTIITRMETMLATTTEGENLKSAEEVVDEVLGEKSKFLQNVQIRPVLPRASGQNSRAELEAERRVNAELRLLVDTQRTQIDDLSKK